MINHSLVAIVALLSLSTIPLVSCSILDKLTRPDAKRDVFKLDHPNFSNNYRLNFKVNYLEERWWKDPQRTVSGYMKRYNLIPEECKEEVEILDSGGTENQSFGWARFRCKPI